MEYAVMLSLIILVCLSAIMTIGQQTASSYQNTAASITSAMGS